VVIATPAVLIAKEATHTIPIVMQSADALATGLVPSLSHPGGNVTGLSLLMTELAGKRMELLRAIRPNLHSVAFLESTKNTAATPIFVREMQAAADRLGVALSVRFVDEPPAIDQAIFDAMKGDGNEAVIISPIFLGEQDRIVAMAMKVQLDSSCRFSRVRRGRGTAELWHGITRLTPANSLLRRSHPQTRQSADRTTDRV
jgi:putative ABC transport system substrate-binding protein